MSAVTTGDRRSSKRALARLGGLPRSVRAGILLVGVGLLADLTVARQDVDLVALGAATAPASYGLKGGSARGRYALRVTGVPRDALRRLRVVPVGVVRDADDVNFRVRARPTGDTRVLELTLAAPPGTYKLVLPGYRPFATVKAGSRP